MKENPETLEAFKERLALARGRLLQREPFLGYLALELPTHIRDVKDDPGCYRSHRWPSVFLQLSLVPSTYRCGIGIRGRP